MPAPCPICQPIICDAPDDTALYSLEQSLFPFVLNCPPGFDCGGSGGFNMVCCGQLLSVSFPPGATADEKTALIQGIVNQCAAILPLCGQGQGCQNPPCNPPPPTTQLFYNRAATCSVPCPDGTVFVFTVPAGTFAALTQAIADQEALDFACQQVVLRRVCLGNIHPCGCVGSFLSTTIPSFGGVGPIIFTLAGGSLPTGLALHLFGNINGTPSVPGTFNFQVKAQTVDGGFVVKAFQMTILQITTTSLPTFTIGVPYSFQLQVTGGSGNYLWKIDAGTLPPGLVMSNTGLITGTPV